MTCSYWNSTQRHKWNFDRQQLLEMRNQVSCIELRFGIPDNHTSDHLISGWNPQLKIFIHNQLLKLGKRLSCRQIIISTAEVYVSRFLLKVSTREVNLYMLLATSLYLASKTEENPQHIRQFLSESRQLWPEYIPNDLTKLAEFEFYLIEELKCFLIVHHPYDSLVTITGILKSEDYNVKLSDEERGTCWSIVNDSYATDIHLLYPPHVVAISALIMVIVLVTKPNDLLADRYEPSGSHYNFSQTGSRLTESAINRLVASSNTNLDQITECIQELIILYENWFTKQKFTKFRIHRMTEEANLRHRKEVRKSKVASGREKQQHIKNKISNETSICSILAKHQLSISVGTLLAVLLSNQISLFQPFAQKFITLQYRREYDAYGIGMDDGYFVFFWVINLTVIRACLMRVVLHPLGRYFSITSDSAMNRFEEQGWSLFYYTTSWVSGFILYYHSDYWLNCDNLYIGWPHEKMTFWFKSYYLIQMSCWLQQIIVLNIEKKRKDYLQMFSHHIITCLLVIGSYYYYFTRIGHVILVLMDVVDIFLAAAKMLKYCGFTISCDLMFIVFVLSWSILRHGVYNYLLYHAMFHSKELMNGDCVTGVLTSRCYSDNVIRVFLGLLTGLQVIAIVWMYLIIKVAVKVIRGSGAEDVRSDDED